MKIVAISAKSAKVAYGTHPVHFSVGPDWALDVPRFVALELLASGQFKLPDGAKNDLADERTEISNALPHEIDVFLNSRPDPDFPQGSVQTHYFNLKRHPLSDKARKLGAEDIADELDNLFQQHHIVVLKGSHGVIAHATDEEKRAYALAYYDAESAGKRPPSVPWRQKDYRPGKTS